MDNIEELSKVGLFENLIDYRNFNSIDACGRVFDYGEHIYRGIFEDSKELAESYFSSGLLSKLEEKGLFPRTIKTNYFLKDYALILEHEKVGNLSYVYEWSFEMIKDAAILVLDVLDTATDYGFTLKDAHPYNIMFHNNRPVWVDLTSLVQGETLGNWPLIELYKSITQPLEFMAINPEIARELYMKDLKYYWPYKVIPEAWGYKKGYNLKNARSLQKIYPRYLKIFTRQGSVTDKDKIHAGIAHYKDKIKNLKLLINANIGRSQWDYIGKNGQITLNPNQIHFLKIANIIKSLPIQSAVEFACNNGLLSAILSENPKMEKLICIDKNDRIIDDLYKMLKNNILPLNCQRKMFPMVLDFNAIDDIICPFFAIKLKPIEMRIRSDAVIALNTSHDLLLSQQIPAEVMFRRFAKLTNRFIFIEFIPHGITWQQDGKIYAQPKPNWYSEEFFVKSMENYFNILYREQTGANRVLFIGEKKE